MSTDAKKYEILFCTNFFLNYIARERQNAGNALAQRDSI